jgi:hypothetical protein
MHSGREDTIDPRNDETLIGVAPIAVTLRRNGVDDNVKMLEICRKKRRKIRKK